MKNIDLSQVSSYGQLEHLLFENIDIADEGKENYGIFYTEFSPWRAEDIVGVLKRRYNPFIKDIIQPFWESDITKFRIIFPSGCILVCKMV